MADHARFSPSAAHRYLACTPALMLEQQFQDQRTRFAEEGTVAHALAEHKLRLALGDDSDRPESSFMNDEMERATEDYVAFALEQIGEAMRLCIDPVVLVEQRVSIEAYVPGTFGTADLLIIADKRLTVVDFKYGKGVEVSADRNVQMMIYALGAHELLGSLYDIRHCRIVIFQPRLDHVSIFELPLDELLLWADTVLRPRARLALTGEGDFAAGEHCRFCKARHTCRARASYFLSLAASEFREPALLSPEEVSEVLQKARQLTQWADDVYTFAEDQAINHGASWAGFKLVSGRTVRRLLDEGEAGKRLMAAGHKDVFRHSLLGIADLERRLGKQAFRTLLGDLIVKPEGKPTLVPDSDRREALESNASTKSDFMEE